MPTIVEVNVITGEKTEREMTAEEIAALTPPVDPPPRNVRAEILDVSQQALASGFLHIMMFDMMQRYLAAAQAIVPTVTEADLLNPESEYYNHAYVETKQYYDQLKALQDLK